MKSTVETELISAINAPKLTITDDDGYKLPWEAFVRNMLGSGSLSNEQYQFALAQISAAYQAGTAAFIVALEDLKNSR